MAWNSKEERNTYQRAYRLARGMKPMKPRAPRAQNFCEICSAPVAKRNQRFCSHKCQGVFLQRRRIELFRTDQINPVHTLEMGRVPRWIKPWWVQQYGECCALCGWCVRHPRTGKVPLEWDHVDGDCSNNRHSNLRLLCPNCHALTDNHGILNYGNSRRRRKWAGVVVIQRVERRT
jgi:hypothetical protein